MPRVLSSMCQSLLLAPISHRKKKEETYRQPFPNNKCSAGWSHPCTSRGSNVPEERKSPVGPDTTILRRSSLSTLLCAEGSPVQGRSASDVGANPGGTERVPVSMEGPEDARVA